MYITITSATIKPATKNDAATITLTGQNLEEILQAENIREDFEPKTYNFIFHADNKREMNYLWKCVKKMSGVSLINKLDSCVGNELYVNASFIDSCRYHVMPRKHS